MPGLSNVQSWGIASAGEAAYSNLRLPNCKRHHVVDRTTNILHNSKSNKIRLGTDNLDESGRIKHPDLAGGSYSSWALSTFLLSHNVLPIDGKELLVAVSRFSRVLL